MPITLNGTTGIIGPDGSASTPAIQGSDTNTGMFFPAADTIAFAEGGAEVARFNSSGNFGLGITPSAWGAYTVLQNKNFSLGGFDYGQGILTLNAYYDGSTWRAIDTGAATQYKHFVGQHQWFTAPSASAGGALTWTQSMTLDASGNLLVGTTSLTGSRMNLQFDNAGQGGIRIIHSSATYNGSAMQFLRANNSTSMGNIYCDGANTSYSTSSDYRLKENIQPMVGGLDKVMRLKPCTYQWKDMDKAGEGFIAHELQEVVPNAVHGEKDAVNEDGSIKAQGIDTSFLVATLTAALQEAHGLIKDLQSRVEVLEAK
jgi:hypothetical protein